MSGPILQFVYAVDGDVLSTVRDYVHKLMRPDTYPCSLCSLTYGALGERASWTCFVRELPVKAAFLHRDEFKAAHPNASQKLPVVLLGGGTGEPAVLVSSDEIDACATTATLVDLVRRRLAAALAVQAAS